MKNIKSKISGSILPAILVVTGVFIIVIYGLIFLVSLQLDFSHRQVASEKALNIAEAGINYYRWHLSHAPEDYQDGTGLDQPYYLHDYTDPQGNVIGQFSLVITPPEEGSNVVTIQSTAWTSQYPKVKRTIKAQYGINSMSEYAFLSNASHWYGEGSIVYGPVHSNNGIRMDGTNYSTVSSSQEEYQCGWETGCDEPTKKPGVWGSGGDQALWKFPVPYIDFDTLSFDFAGMRDSAVSDGLYLPPSNKDGYHLIFFEDGTVRVNLVEKTNWLDGYRVPGQGLGEEGVGGCRHTYQQIDTETFVGNYSTSESPIIFVEDNVWVEGTVKGRVTLAAVDFPISSAKADIWIADSLLYTNYDGTDSLGLVAQNDIFFVRDVPDYFQVDAVLMSQKGSVMRHGYFDWCGGTEGAVKQKLTLNGSIISYFKSYWNFGSGPESGFIEREINYDQNVLFQPPPYFPNAGGFEFISWVEE